MTGVKVTSILPGLVNTPLLTADKQKQFSYADSKALTPDGVASHMLELLQKKEYECGSMLQLSMAGPQLVPEWNISAPVGEGTGNEYNDMQDMVKTMIAPIEEKLGTERGSARVSKL
jgi:NAD(P)-dependent dehydrogenase (short-subunit alcohol dehydrogenase family)